MCHPTHPIRAVAYRALCHELLLITLMMICPILLALVGAHITEKWTLCLVLNAALEEKNTGDKHLWGILTTC